MQKSSMFLDHSQGAADGINQEDLGIIDLDTDDISDEFDEFDDDKLPVLKNTYSKKSRPNNSKSVAIGSRSQGGHIKKHNIKEGAEESTHIVEIQLKHQEKEVVHINTDKYEEEKQKKNEPINRESIVEEPALIMSKVQAKDIQLDKTIMEQISAKTRKGKMNKTMSQE